MKKSLLIIAAMTTLGLVACGEKTPEVPVEEGKVTFYLELGADYGVTSLNEWESIFVTGGFNGFATGYNAFEFQQLGETTTYYAQVSLDAVDFTANQGTEYQLLLGYNQSAGLGEKDSGLQWIDTRKSYECNEGVGGGLGNPTFEYTEGAQTINLGTHNFKANLEKVEPIQNVTLSLELTEALPEYGQILIFGSFNGWQTPGEGKDNAKLINDAKMTPDADRKVFTYHLAEVLPGDYECCFCCEYTTVTDSITWNKVGGDANIPFSITGANAGKTVDVIGEPQDFNLVDPDAKRLPLTIEVVNEGGALTAEKLLVCGNFTNWTHVDMTKEDENKWTYTFADGVNAAPEFGVMSKDDWSDKVSAGGANITVETLDTTKSAIKFTITCDFSKFGSEGQPLAAEKIVVSYSN